VDSQYQNVVPLPMSVEMKPRDTEEPIFNNDTTINYDIGENKISKREDVEIPPAA
ncbi:IS481 family transposase, partial [Elizabethkingia anophelis]